jgi:Tfp pilus assembly protein PilF
MSELSMIERLEALLAAGNDNAQIRFGLAIASFDSGNMPAAREHARIAVEHDADYSAAWRVLGRAEAALGLDDDARKTFERGIEIAERKGDRQLVKEMRVFLGRLEKRD